MSSLSYRDWDVFLNERIRERGAICHGFYECIVPGFLMTGQTIGFLLEHFELRSPRPVAISRGPLPADANARLLQNSAALPVQIFGQFDPNGSCRAQIDKVVNYLGALAMCVDFPLHVQTVQFVDLQQGTVLQASRRNIGRGVGFEIEERGSAVAKVSSDFDFFHGQLASQRSSVKVAIRHYLTGMTLLSLEDVAPGLIDAAYMQFYQGIEALVGKDTLEEAKKAIAVKLANDSYNAQIVCHQVFAVRHKYFGHGSETDFHEIADAGPEEAMRVAKQCLVVRWLCRLLIDAETPSMQLFAREMRLYGPNGSDEFRGTSSELERSFWIEFGQASPTRPKRNCKIYDRAGAAVDSYLFPLGPSHSS